MTHAANPAGASTRLARCSCGQLRLQVSGEPVRISVCHCLACQRRTGSVFGAQARFPAAAVSIEGRSTRWSRHGDSGGAIVQHFCPSCGATVYYLLDAAPGFVAVPVGAFADPAFPSPSVSVYGELAHAWVSLPDAIKPE